MANAVDKEQIEMLSKWWSNYGKGILLAIVLALFVVFGWRYWNEYKVNHQTAASGVYQGIFAAAEARDFASIDKSVSLLKEKYSDTPYAAFGAMMAARLDVDANRIPAALDQLHWVIENAKVKSFKQIARLSMARILVSQKKYDAAQLMLATLDDPSFKAYVDDVRGQLNVDKGDLSAAKLAFQSAKLGFQDANMTDALVNMQLNAIER